MRLWALLVGSLILGCTLAAQESDEPSRGPDGGTHIRVEGIRVLPLAGKPFSGRSTTEWTRTLEDGTVVATRLFAMVARDSQGRIYRERRHFVPADSGLQSALTHILIYDPVLTRKPTAVLPIIFARCRVIRHPLRLRRRQSVRSATEQSSLHARILGTM